MTTPAVRGQNPDLAAGLTALLAAMPDYERAARYYDGKPDEWFSNPRLARKLQNTANLRLNFAQTPVNAVVEGLELAAVTVVGTDTDKAQAALDGIREHNEMDLELQNLFLRACEYGDAYLMLDVDEEADDGATPTPELFYNSPLVGRMMYRNDNPRRPAYYVRRWHCNDPRTETMRYRLNLVYADKVERYVTSNTEHKGLLAEEFEPYVGPGDDTDEDDPHIIDHPLSEYGIPFGVYHLRAGGRPYGNPEHVNAYGPQDAINKLAIIHLDTADYMSAPQRWALENLESTNSTEDDIDDIYRSEQVASAAEGTTGVDPVDPVRQRSRNKLTAGPGGMHFFKGITEVGQFDPADVSGFLESIVLYIKIMAHVSTTPAYHFDLPGEVPSGESQRAANKPLNDKRRNRQMSFTGPIRRALQDALTVVGFADTPVTLQWAALEVVDDADGWATAANKIAAGVPLRQVFLDQGFTTVQLDAWGIPASKYISGITLTQQAALFAAIGDGAQKMAAAVALGTMTNEQVAEVVQALIDAATPEEDQTP